MVDLVNRKATEGAGNDEDDQRVPVLSHDTCRIEIQSTEEGTANNKEQETTSHEPKQKCSQLEHRL